MNNLIVQVFLVVLVIGGFGIVLFLFLKNVFTPKKISAIKHYIKDGNFKAAINLAKEVINKDRANVEAHYYLGDAYYNQQKFELALIEYKIAEKSGFYDKISEKTLRDRLAELYGRTNNIEESLKEYILLTKKYPSDFLYLFKVGELFEKKEMDQQAVKYYSDCLELNKNYIPALTNIGVLLYNVKNYSESNQYLRTAVSKDPSSYKAYFYLGLLSKAENNFKSAMKYFDKAMKDKDYKVRSLMERGKLHMMQNKHEEAVVELDRALKNCGEEEENIKTNIRYVLANCYEQNRNIMEAIALWEQIYAIRPNFKDVGEKLTNYQELRIDDAMKDFLTATDVDFLDICKGIITGMGLNITDQEIISKDSVEFLCLESDEKWRNVKKRPKLIHISRRNSPIDEVMIRNIHEKMREKAVIRGVVISSTEYSKLALSFAKERPIELIDKTKLEELLREVSR